ncbi:MAG TPA: DNA translocase FtsK [Candidatus Scybalousia intestinigallinarum]|nr:DNA translocase FtsK [Candidatus Scybalousia intestinigallinarum]
MAKRKKKKESPKQKFEHWNELVGLVLIIVSILSIVPTPLGFIGQLGASFAMFLIGTWYQVLLLFTFVVGCYMVYKRKVPNFATGRFMGLYALAIGLLVLGHINYVKENTNDILIVFKATIDNLLANFSNIMNGAPLTLKGAGIIGATFSIVFYKLFAIEGTYIVSVVLLLLSIVLLTGVDLIGLCKKPFQKLRRKKKKPSLEDTGVIVNDSSVLKEVPNEDNKIRIHSIDELTKVKDEHKEGEDKGNLGHLVTESEAEANTLSNEPVRIQDHTNYHYQLPPLSLIPPTKKPKNSNGNEVIEANIVKLEKVLKDFNIIAKVVEVNVGPSVTQYELEISSGTKVNKILSLSREISLALAKKDVRIQAPIPGKSTVGIELANDTITPVGLREILESVPANKEKSKLLVALGKNIMGNSIFCEIDKTPHLLVAGSTGSGKSVCINCMIASILMRTKPTEVKLVLVDPKKVELSMYNGIPHLLIPVVTDPKKASDALKRIVREMEDRYDIFSDKGVKNIATYNEWVDKQNEGRSEEEKIPHMFYIVVIVDELADLMLVASKEVEDSIMRITQMARAAGIHLIVATQRPSTDVITGVVKANIPSRISFAVSSSIDSRTILDATGAEKLLGKGDMLFLPMGENAPVRVQGAFVSDEDLQKIVDYTVSQQKAQYDERFMNLGESSNNDNPSMEEVRDAPEEYDDPLYNEIVEFVITSGKASASLLQRRFRLGYNRAARCIDLLEERGIIGPANGSKPREVLVKLDDEE